MRLLDVGCGTGDYLRAIEREIVCEVWGIEPSLKVARVLRPGGLVRR